MTVSELLGIEWRKIRKDTKKEETFREKGKARETEEKSEF